MRPSNIRQLIVPLGRQRSKCQDEWIRSVSTNNPSRYQRYSAWLHRFVLRLTLIGWILATRSSRETGGIHRWFIDYYRRYTCIIPYQVRLESYRVLYYRIKESTVTRARTKKGLHRRPFNTLHTLTVNTPLPTHPFPDLIFPLYTQSHPLYPQKKQNNIL